MNQHILLEVQGKIICINSLTTLFNIHAISYGGAGHESVYFHGGVGGNLDLDDSLNIICMEGALKN